MRQNTGVDRLPRSTLSDANKVFDPTLLEPLIEELRARGGLRDLIPDPAAWQRELRQDRPLPGRD
jgi:hypothetical protein